VLRTEPARTRVPTFRFEASLLDGEEALAHAADSETSPALYVGANAWDTAIVSAQAPPGTVVTFSVKAGVPDAAWRDETLRNYRPTWARLGVTGRVRSSGSFSATCTAIADSEGVARCVYRASHFGTLHENGSVDLGSKSPAWDLITATSQGGSRTARLITAYERLVEASALPPLPAAQDPALVGVYRKSGLQTIVRTWTRPGILHWLAGIDSAVRSLPAPRALVVNDLSERFGGVYRPHYEHGWGMNVDIRPISPNPYTAWNGALPSGPMYDLQTTIAVAAAVYESGGRLFYNDPAVRVAAAGEAYPLATEASGHNDHLHADWSPRECRKLSDWKQEQGRP
jgi:hypothetical protein